MPEYQLITVPDSLIFDFLDSQKYTQKEMIDHIKKFEHHALIKMLRRIVYTEKRIAIVVILGKRGIGKSWLALTLASMIDPSFANVTNSHDAEQLIKERVVIKAREYTKAINNKRLRRGNVVIFDEAGVGAAAREWQSANNKLIDSFNQVSRHLGIISIFALPSWSFLDVHFRAQTDYIVIIKNVDKSRNKTITTIREVPQHNRVEKFKDQPLFFPHLILRDHRQREDHFPRPPKLLTKAYDKYSIAYKLELEAEIQRKLEKNEHIEEFGKNRIDKEKIVDEICNDIVKYLRPYRGITRIHLPTVAAQFGISQTAAATIRVKVEKKLKEQGRNIDNIQL